MSRRPGLSEDEKKKRLTTLLWERRTVFNMKEIESLGNKEKGVTPQSIKPLIEVLVADGIVEQDKLGSGSFFWAFPSKEEKKKRAQIEKIKADIATLHTDVKAAKASLTQAQASRQPTKERKMKIEKLSQLKRKRAEIENDSKEFMVCDPDTIKKLRQGVPVCRDGANRWTDNIELLISYYKNKLGGDLDEKMRHGLLEQIGLPKEIDNLE